MSDINRRISECISYSGLTKTAFAERINVSQQHVSRLAKDGTPSDRTISDICREFGISEVWLRTGEGPMKLPQSEDEEFQRAVADIQLHDERMKEVLKFYWRLPPEKKAFVWEMIDGLSGK